MLESRGGGEAAAAPCRAVLHNVHITRTESHVFVSNETAQDTSANEDFQIKTKPTEVS